MQMLKRHRIPEVLFHTRVHSMVDGKYHWKDVGTWDIFAGRKILLFSLPGAFTPTCSTYQLPDFEKMAPEFYAKGIDAIYCISVNDTFVMNAWAMANNLKEVKVIPDGSGIFTHKMGMLVSKDNLGFGQRSWRYAALVKNKEILHSWVEPGMKPNAEDDPYGETSPQKILGDLNELHF